MSKSMEGLKDDEVAALRIIIAALFLFPLTFKYKLDIRKHWKGLFFMGFFGNFFPAFLFTKAETGINSSLAGMLNSLTPLFTIILGMLFFKTKTNLKQVIGILIGLAGAITLMYKPGAMANQPWNYALMVVLATFCYAISVNAINHYLKGVNPIAASAHALLMMLPLAVIYLLRFTNYTSHALTTESLHAMNYLCTLAIVGTALAVIIFNWLIHSAGVMFASSVTYVIPIVAIGWGVLMNEYISGIQYIGIVIILLGVYIINTNKQV